MIVTLLLACASQATAQDRIKMELGPGPVVVKGHLMDASLGSLAPNAAVARNWKETPRRERPG